MIGIARCWCALVLLSITGCVAPPVGTDAPVHVVVLGSSTAEGIGPSHPDSAWVNRYRARLRRADSLNRVTNLARGGYTTYEIMPNGFVQPTGRPAPDTARNITRALALAPDAIIINLPSNDVAYGYTVAEQLANYDTILARAAAAGIPLWITTTQPRNLAAGRPALMAMRDSTFARFGDFAIDFWSDFAKSDGGIDSQYDCGDGIHLNDRAHRMLLNRVQGRVPVD